MSSEIFNLHLGKYFCNFFRNSFNFDNDRTNDYIFKCKCKHMKWFHTQKHEKTFIELKSL